MFNRILVIGATGLLGKPVVERFLQSGHTVRALTRSRAKVERLFGGAVEITEGSAIDIDDVRAAMAGCDAVHINLTPAVECTAASHVIEVADGGLGRLGYVSATTLSEELRWFDRVDVKMRTEELIRSSGLPYVVFCPTWVMETLQNFIRAASGPCPWTAIVLPGCTGSLQPTSGEWSLRPMRTTGRWGSACSSTGRKGSLSGRRWIVSPPPATQMRE